MMVAKVFDRRLLRQRRQRAVGQAAAFDFLFKYISRQLNERLDMITRVFPVVLDLGATTGAMTKHLKIRKGTDIVVSADFVPSPGEMPLVMDAEALPFAENTLDAVVSCLDLQWVNDLPGTLLQIRKALKPDGMFLAAMPGGETLHELRNAMMEAEIKITGGASPRVAPFADVRDVGALLQRAGFALPVVDIDRVIIDYDSPLRLMKDLQGMGASNAILTRLKKPTPRSVIFEAVKVYQEKFGKDSRIPATFDIIYAIGWAPHQSQQQPLPRGSGETSLADILCHSDGA